MSKEDLNSLINSEKVLRRSLFIKLGALLLLTAILITTFFFVSYSEDVNQKLSEHLIRLHVVANSDSEEDQALKREVRDQILEYMRVQLKETTNIEESRNILIENLNTIEELAKKEITEQGKDYDVKAVMGNFSFPTKAYGDITLPAGDYQALRVVLGKGEGANWWCVLFPPLCFVDATHGTIPESVKQELKAALSDEEYAIVASADLNDQIPVRIKFKIVEFFQESKIRFDGIIKSLFK